ncbi:O-methyltransferase [Pedobacter glucosidilyticus]|uniref:O-methyltransferase n=1 Tax=Pedobacter glucosidilyticus TaxID=1122941 RepID=UPI0026F31DFA|nr:class I SAM-dependent methyltransferase [Pedobacter glucosidilyticus]
MLNIQFALDYIAHRINAKTRHGVHSPFVYKLIDEVIYDFKDKPEYKSIEELRKNLLQDHRNITITDLGAGSQLNNQKVKAVKELAKNALKAPRLAKLLFRLVQYTQPKTLIELGTCLGITTAYLAKADENLQVITMEGCPQTAAVAQENFNKLGLKYIQLEVGNFDERLPVLLQNKQQLDVVFIDGNHRKDATLNYFNWCLPKVHENSLLIFDDIYWSKGMKEAWAEIKAHPQVSVTVDLFWIGLVFFKKGIAKEDFKVKF